MKKKILFLMFFAAIATSCIGQSFNIKSISINDLDNVKRYLRNNINSLDPIEGIYSVSLSRFTTGYNAKSSYSFKYAIIRSGEKNSFYMRKLKPLGERFPKAGVSDAVLNRIGETNFYDIKLEYITDGEKEIAATRVDLSSLTRFQFKTSKSDYDNYELHAFYTYNDDFDCIKEFPTPSMYKDVISQDDKNKSKDWTGTGFAIGNGYIVTNYHVAGYAKSLNVKGIKGDMNTGYIAEVVAKDKGNDIAILKITDSRFKGFGTVPYAIRRQMANVGEDIFVLGYPLTQALGNEIKTTNGIISSRTGYQDDVSTYQISAPVQPGNSGGPMFDKNGNVIGIVVAGVPGAENVGYAIKTSYLMILLESIGITPPSKNTIVTLSLSEKVKRIKNFVLYIECSK